MEDFEDDSYHDMGGLRPPTAHSSATEVNVYLRALEGVRQGRLAAQRLVERQRLRGSSHVSPAPVAGPARYASLPATTGIHSPAMIIAANRVPRAPSIVARMPSVAGEHAIPISDRTPARPLYGGGGGSSSSGGGYHRSSPADSRGGAGRAGDAGGRSVRGSPGDYSAAGSVAGGAAGHDQHRPRGGAAAPAVVRRVISPRVAARDSLPAELRDLRTTPVELPIYLPLHTAHGGAGATAGTAGIGPRARALGSGDADVSADSVAELPLRELPLRNRSDHGGRGSRKDRGDRDSSDAARPINVTIQLPKEAFEHRGASAAAAAAAREPPPSSSAAAGSGLAGGNVLYPIVLPLHRGGSSGSNRRREQEKRRQAEEEEEAARRARSREVVVPIVLQRAAPPHPPPAPAPAARVEPLPPSAAPAAPADTALSEALQSMWRDVMKVLSDSMASTAAQQAELLARTAELASARSQAPAPAPAAEPVAVQPAQAQPAVSDELIMQMLLAASLRSQLESGTSASRPLRDMLHEVWESTRSLAARVGDVEALARESLHTGKTLAEHVADGLQRASATAAAVESLGAALHSKSAAVEAAIAASSDSIRAELRATGEVIADGVRAQAAEAAASCRGAAAAAAQEARAGAVSDLVPSLALLADEMHAASTRAEESRSALAAVAAAVPALEAAQAETRAAVAAHREESAQRVDAVASDLADVARAVAAVEAEAAEVLRLLRERRSSAPCPSAPSVPAAAPAADESEEEEEHEQSVSAGQVFPLPDDALGTNASLAAAAAAPSVRVLGYYAMAAGSGAAAPGAGSAALARSAAERAYLTGDARNTVGGAATGRASEGADAAASAAASAASGGALSHTVPLPRLSASDDSFRTAYSGATFSSTGARGLASAVAAAAGAGAAGGAAIAQPGGSTSPNGLGLVDFSASGALRESRVVPHAAAAAPRFVLGSPEAASLARGITPAGGRGPFPLQELDPNELSAGEVLLAEDFSAGELVELVPITEALSGDRTSGSVVPRGS